MAKKRKYNNKQPVAPELNVMPFIDIFSMLNTFLLVSASFIGLGILEVQIPFFSNATEVTEAKPERLLTIRVDTTKEDITLTTLYSEDPEEKEVLDYKMDAAGIEQLHTKLIDIRIAEPKTEKVMLFADDDVKYENMVLVLDAIKTLKENDPPVPARVEEGEAPKEQSGKMLYDKVVIGSVIL